MNHSPWIAQLNPERIVNKIDKDVEYDVTVVGGGIAGIATAFFVLTRTNKKVVLVEASKVAHGATGHNAGQVTSYFERGFASMVTEFGIDAAKNAQQAVEDAWILLDEMYTTAHVDIPFDRFVGHAGLSTEEQVLLHLENNYQRAKAGLATEQFIIAEHVPFLDRIPEQYRELYSIVSHDKVLEKLESHNAIFIAVISYQKGCINSALLCQEVLQWMNAHYGDRFVCYEHCPVHKIALRHDRPILDVGTYTITTDHVVLCTNGFDTIKLFDEHGLMLDTKLRHSVSGIVGYMSAYVDPMQRPPLAASYLLQPDRDDAFYQSDTTTGDPYFLITRRQYRHNHTNEMLISVAGPEVSIEDRKLYSRESEFPDAAQQSIDHFIKGSYIEDPTKPIEYLFTWHGLMGYTPNGIRLIGTDPHNDRLMYNLGCNGIGILPSVFGAHRIAQIVRGDTLEPTIFDPK